MSKNRTNILFIRLAYILLVCISVLFSLLFEQRGLAAEPLIFTKVIGHRHIGGSGSGCYTALRTGTRTEERNCTGTMVYYPALGTTGCDSCGAGYSGDQSGRSCWTTFPYTVSYSYYDLGCGIASGAQLGTITVRQSTGEWTKALTLTASYENGAAMGVGEKPYIWNGQAGEEDTLEVTENGTYQFRLNAGANTNAGEAVIVLPIRNIDTTAPMITEYQLSPEEWTNEAVIFTITETADIQSDGTEGCGLHEAAFSYDEGKTWTDERQYCYEKNGTCQVLVRDKLENCSSISFTIANIDRTGPTITKMDYDHGDNIAATSLTVEAVDIQPDESEGAGLPGEPYSYDGGKTWSANNILAVEKSGVILLAVRDKLGNVTHTELDIQNIDSCGPRVEYVLVPDYWTNRYVNVCFSAEDMKENGTAGVGLPGDCYSYDGGDTWCEEDFQIMHENGSFEVKVRDLYGYTTAVYVTVSNIDKAAPGVELSYGLQEAEGRQIAVLHVMAEDHESGLHEQPFSWNGAPYTKEGSCTVTENGTYTIAVRDRAGNITNADILIKELEEKKINAVIQKVLPGKEDKPEKKEPVKIKKQMRELVSRPEAQVQKEVEKAGPDYGIILLVSAALLFLLLLLFLVFLWYRTAAVYVEEEQAKFKLLGRVWIHRKEEKYQIGISDSMWQQCRTTHFRFMLCPVFVYMHEKEEVCILFPEEHVKNLMIEQVMETVLL